MEPTTKEHIKYQFCNVYNDLLADLKNLSRVKPDNAKDNDISEISLAPSPEKKKAPAPSAYKTRGRSRLSKTDDVFGALKASRQKKKKHTEHPDEITAVFDSSCNFIDGEGRMQVIADIHRDASQPPAPASAKKSGQTTIDEMFDALLNKKSKETEINCSQDSDDFFQVAKKKTRSSYPGASRLKNKTIGKKKPCKELSDSLEGLRNFDFESDDDTLKMKTSKSSNLKSEKPFPSVSKCTSTAVDDLDSDKSKSSPGWSRIRKLEEDFKDSSYKKPLNISISKSRQSLSKSSFSVTPNTKVGNSSNLNISTSDSDQSEVRYFESPDAVKRCQLMKHIVEKYEKNELDIEIKTPRDPSIERLATSLLKERKQFVKKLIDSTKSRNSEIGEKKHLDDEPLIENQEEFKSIENLSPLKTKAQNSRRLSKPIVETAPPENCIDISEKEAELSDVHMTDLSQGLNCSQNNSIQFITEFDNVQTVEDISNERLGTCENMVGTSPDKISALEHSNNCDVSEKPLSTIAKPGGIGVTRKKLDTQSKELDNLLTQVVVTSTTENSAPKTILQELTPALTSSSNLCARCRCSIDKSELSQSRISNKQQNSTPKRQENVTSETEKLKTERKDACVQTDDFHVSEIRSTHEISVQTMPTTLTLETIPSNDKSDENAVRHKDEFILQTLKALMIQASHKLTINDLYNLGIEQENEPPRKKLKEITANQNVSSYDDDIVRNDHLVQQTWAVAMGRNASNETVLHPPAEIKTPQNQLIKRKISSDMKYSFVSTPSSSERKLIDDSKFLNGSTVCLKDVTICENENVNPAEDYITKDLVPMEITGESPIKIEPLPCQTDEAEKVQNPVEIDCSNLNVVRIRERLDSSNSNDSMILSSKKSAHRSLNFQNFFSKVNDDAISSLRVDSSHFLEETKNVNQKNDDLIEAEKSSSKPDYFDVKCPVNNLVEEEFSEDIRKSLSVLESLGTPKAGDREAGIVENSDDESIIQATPKKNKLANEMTLTPDMLSSQTSQSVKEKGRESSCLPETGNGSNRFGLQENYSQARPLQTDSDSSSSRQPNSNIDSQVTEIPSSIVPTCDDYLSKRLERKNKNNLCNGADLNQIPKQNTRLSQMDAMRPKPIQEVDPIPYDTTAEHENKGPEDGLSGATKSCDFYVSQKPKRLFIATSALPRSLMFSTQEFCKQFNCVYESEITERTTHLVVRTNNNKALSTMKFILAVATHKLIVTVDWINACSKENKLLPEDSFIPLSSSGQPGPLNSLMDKNTASLSPLLKSFIIHVVPPFSNCSKENFVELLIQCGAKIAESYVDLAADKARVRLILVNAEGAEERGSFYRGLVYRYKAFILVHDWAIESISNYKVEPFSNHNPLNVVYGFEMVNYFQIPPYVINQVSQYFESNEDSYEDTVSEMSTLPH